MAAAQERGEHQPQPGDLVDIWYDPPSKGTPGWRGPAHIASVKIVECSFTVRFQGGVLDRRHQEVRAHVPHLAYLPAIVDHKSHQWSIFKREV